MLRLILNLIDGGDVEGEDAISKSFDSMFGFFFLFFFLIEKLRERERERERVGVM